MDYMAIAGFGVWSEVELTSFVCLSILLLLTTQRSFRAFGVVIIILSIFMYVVDIIISLVSVVHEYMGSTMAIFGRC